MKKKLLIGGGVLFGLLVIALVFPHVYYAGKHSPQAWKTYEEGLLEAKASGKPVLLKIYSDY